MDLGDPVPAELKPISNSEPPVYFVRILYLSLIKYTGGVKMTSPRVARFDGVHSTCVRSRLSTSPASAAPAASPPAGTAASPPAETATSPDAPVGGRKLAGGT